MYKLFMLSILLFCLPLFAQDQKIIIVRHGDSDSNVEKVYNSNPDHANYKVSNLTDKGKKEIAETAKNLTSQGFKDNSIAVVFVSPLPRTRQTADILAKEGLFSPSKIKLDTRLVETQAGDLEGKPIVADEEFHNKENHTESDEQVKDRMQKFYDSIKDQYPTGTIVVVTHGLPAVMLQEVISGSKDKFKTAEAKVLPLKKN